MAITDPLGNTTRREFDSLNRCVAETDPLGRTTRAGYDAAGRLAWQEEPSGSRTSWTYDESGRIASSSVDGRTVSAISRDLRARTVTLTDHTRPDGLPMVHEMEWNRRGQLVRRSRDDRSLSWTYDLDGRRASMTTPDGHTTGYARDAAGRLVAVDHPLLGRAVLERDAAGRIVGATADGVIQTWEHRDGFVVGHTVGDADGFTRTEITRDEQGRITAIDRGGETTGYGYDEACQLIEARVGDVVARWRYDQAGHLVSESAAGAGREHVYDPAGQLIATTVAGGVTTRHSYDAVGRRTRTEHGPDRVREYSWSPTGRLSGITDQHGNQVQRTSLHVDAQGELASVDSAPLFWDSANPYAPALVQVGDVPIVPAGPVTGIGTEAESGWAAPGWRTARSEGPSPTDPWAIAPAETPRATGLPAGIGIGSAGELTLAGGMEWLGARVYDPATRGFLSTDPLEPVPGAGWAGNPYAYAGNDPLHALDPTGLRPVTDAELKAYAAAHQGALHAAGDWMKDNWEYVAGGAMVIAGGVLIATGVGGPAGMMLVSAGADTIIQKATTGKVNWGEVAISGAFGAWGGGGAAARLGATSVLGKAVVGGMVSGATSGATGGAYTYMSGPGPHSPGGLLTSTAMGAGVGGVTGGAGAAAGHGLDTLGRRLLTNVPPAPLMSTADEARALLGNPGDTVVLGRQADTAIANGWDGHVVLNTDRWSLELNDEFVRGTIDYQRPVYLASPIEGNMIQTSGSYANQPTIYARELDMLRDAGYQPDGDYLVPGR